MLSFSAGWTKHNRTSIGIARGHNTRAHPTASQLPESAWFTPQGRHEIKAWDEGVVNRAKALAKRKDAVIAIELSIQVGNQSDWRSMPTPEHPEGRPRPDMRKHLKPLAKAAYEAAVREFGEANVISADLHTDESTPHMQITVVPIRNGKLDAKSWLDGAARCAALRKRLHSVVAKRIACEYTPGGPGGAPHDPRKAAGGPDAPKPSRGLLRAAIDAVDVVREVSAMRREIKALKASIQSLHTRARQQERAAERDRVERQEAERRARKAESVERDLRARIAQLEADLAKREPGRRPAPAAGAHPRKG